MNLAAVINGNVGSSSTNGGSTNASSNLYDKQSEASSNHTNTNNAQSN